MGKVALVTGASGIQGLLPVCLDVAKICDYSALASIHGLIGTDVVPIQNRSSV